MKLLSVVVRFHEGANINLLTRALYSLLDEATIDREVIVMVQFAEEAVLTEVRTLCQELFAPGSCRVVGVRAAPGEDRRGALLAQGVSLAEGCYIAFLDYDDMLLLPGLADCIALCEQEQADLAIAQCFVAFVEGVFPHDYIVTKERFVRKPPSSPFALLLQNFAPLCAVVVSRPFLLRTGINFSSALARLEDYDFLLRVLAAGTITLRPLASGVITAQYNLNVDVGGTTLVKEFAPDTAVRQREEMTWEAARDQIRATIQSLTLRLDLHATKGLLAATAGGAQQDMCLNLGAFVERVRRGRTKRSVAKAAMEPSPVDGLPNAVSVITRWSRPFGDDDGSAAYFWAVVTWWVKFGVATYGGSLPRFLTSLSRARFVEERTALRLPSGKSISVPTALARFNPPEWADFSAKAGHTIAYSVPDYDLFDLIFRDPPFVRAAILDFDFFVEWLATLPTSPDPVPLLARYVAELVARRPAGIEVDGVEASLRDWIGQTGRSGHPQTLDRIFAQARARRAGDNGGSTSVLATTRANDVDVYGHFAKPIGLGEDARLMARAFEAAGFRVNRIDLDAGMELGQPTAPVGFWALPAPNFALRALRFTPAHDAQLTVIATPWELPETPPCLHWVYRVSDVACVYSDFVAASLPQDVRATVIKIPLPFDCAAIAAVGRTTPKADFFTFVTVFDFWSSPKRKGPQRAIAAFQRAFGPTDPVRLVVKSMHGDAMPEQFAALKQMAAGDSRITLVDAEWSTHETLRLLARAHAFLSLHASEGFGRVLAESMLLDTLVVATDYSGSREICRQDTALTLPYELVPISHEDYLLGDGQRWALPDADAAADVMRDAFRDWDAADMVAIRKRARERVRKDFSLEVTAATLRDLFNGGWRKNSA